MKRREFLGSLVATGGWPLMARAQNALPRIGLLSAGSATSAYSALFNGLLTQALAKEGLVEGRNCVLDTRYAAGDYSLFPKLALDLANAGARLILANTIASVRAAQALPANIPVVMISINNPVQTGLIASLARPGGKTTGMSTLAEDLTPKLLDLIRELIPSVKRLCALYNPANPSNPILLQRLKDATGPVGINVVPVALKPPSGVSEAFVAVAAAKADMLILVPDLAATSDLGDQIAQFAIASKLPSIAIFPEYTALGGLMGYGVPTRYLAVKTAHFVKRILDGADPAELPVEQSTQIELVVNLKTAKALGLSMPASLLTRAGEVIE